MKAYSYTYNRPDLGKVINKTMICACDFATSFLKVRGRSKVHSHTSSSLPRFIKIIWHESFVESLTTQLAIQACFTSSHLAPAPTNLFQRNKRYSKGKLDRCALYTSNYSQSSSFRPDTNIATAEAKTSNSQHRFHQSFISFDLQYHRLFL